jgi:hypothetical protein
MIGLILARDLSENQFHPDNFRTAMSDDGLPARLPFGTTPVAREPVHAR